MKKILLYILTIIFVLAFSGCDSENTAVKKKLVGVSMPTLGSDRWSQDGSNIKASLERNGYEVDLLYGNEEIETQISDVKKLIEKNCDVLIITAVDCFIFSDVLKEAKEKNIPVIAYDRLIMNTDAITYYATFDNYGVGKIQGEYIRDSLNLDTENGPFNIELIAGGISDNNTPFFFKGMIDVLKPYIDNGKLVIKSNRTSLEQCTLPSWSSEEAQIRMEELIKEQNYSPAGERLDAVLASNDLCADGIISALRNAGYSEENMPVITGQDCDLAGMRNIINGYQNMSVFKDTRDLAKRAVDMTNAILNGTGVIANDIKSYNNGNGVIASYLCEPVLVTAENYRELLIDSGYYTEKDITADN